MKLITRAEQPTQPPLRLPGAPQRIAAVWAMLRAGAMHRARFDLAALAERRLMAQRGQARA